MSQWMSLYLSHHSSVFAPQFDRFLVEVVKPFVAECEEAGWVDGFFFIRFADRLPHVRLRLRGSRPVLLQHARPRLEERVRDYFDRYPLQDRSALWPATQRYQNGPEFFVNGTIHEVPYEQEIGRFGGPVGMALAEDLFEHSSRVALDWLAQNVDRPFEEKLGFGMQCHLLILAEVVHDPAAIEVFCENNVRALLDAELGHVAAELWSKSDELRRFLDGAYGDLETPLPVTTLHRAYEARFDAAPPEAFAPVQAFWNEVQERGPLDDLLPRLQEALRSSFDHLRRGIDDGSIEIANIKRMPAHQQTQAAAASFMHFHNNRLGLHLTEESWISYVAQRCLGQAH